MLNLVGLFLLLIYSFPPVKKAYEKECSMTVKFFEEQLQSESFLIDSELSDFAKDLLSKESLQNEVTVFTHNFDQKYAAYKNVLSLDAATGRKYIAIPAGLHQKILPEERKALVASHVKLFLDQFHKTTFVYRNSLYLLITLIFVLLCFFYSIGFLSFFQSISTLYVSVNTVAFLFYWFRIQSLYKSDIFAKSFIDVSKYLHLLSEQGVYSSLVSPLELLKVNQSFLYQYYWKYVYSFRAFLLPEYGFFDNFRINVILGNSSFYPVFIGKFLLILIFSFFAILCIKLCMKLLLLYYEFFWQK